MVGIETGWRGRGMWRGEEKKAFKDKAGTERKIYPVEDKYELVLSSIKVIYMSGSVVGSEFKNKLDGDQE